MYLRLSLCFLGKISFFNQIFKGIELRLIWIIIIVSFLASSMAFAQLNGDGAINGYVKEDGSEETLVGATVYVIGTKKGAYTNKLGFYSISGLKPGNYQLRISSVGYETKVLDVSIAKDKTLRNDVILSKGEILTQEVHVQAEREIEKREISVSKINIPVEQMKEIRIGGESDVFRAIQLLPGVLASSQISSGLYIRGGSPDQNLVLLDGSTVYNPTHLFGFFSAFNSEAIKDVELIKGGYPAEFGSRMSAVLNITQKDGNKNEYHGLFSLGTISSKLSFEGPIGNGSFFLGGRRTYFEIIKLALPDEEDIPDFGFYDINAKVAQDIGENDKVFVSGFVSRDFLTFDQSGFDLDILLGNTSGSARWTHIFGSDLFTDINFTGSNYFNEAKQDLSGFSIRLKNSINDYSLKGSVEWFANSELTLKSGFSISNYRFHYEQNFTGSDDEVEEGTAEGGVLDLVVYDHTYDAFAQANYQFTDLLSLQAGLRGSYWDLSKKTVYDPRLAFRWQMQDEFAIKATWGIFHQYLRLASNENLAVFDTWLPTDRTVQPSQANHFILSFETEPFEDIDLNFDFYYKTLNNISEVNQKSLEGSTVTDVFFNGNGEAYGFEVFMQKKVGKLAGWIGYAYGHVVARFDSINGGEEYRPKFDRRHDLKIVTSYQHDESWNFSANFTFQSGQSYTGASSFYRASLPSQNFGKTQVYPTQRYGLRLPASHQLNMSASYTTTLFGLPFKLILDIFNVYSRRDILFRYYETDEEVITVKDVELLPIIPSVSIELKF